MKKKFVFSVIILLILAVLSGCENKEDKEDILLHEANNKFSEESSQLNFRHDDTLNKIIEAEELLENTLSSDLMDPMLLTQLKDQIASTKKVTIDIPIIAVDIETINAQVEDILTQKIRVVDQYNKLEDSVNEVLNSKQELISRKESYSLTATDSNGYKAKITLTIGKWIKGSDTEKIENAWMEVGGTGNMPLTGTYSRKDMMLIDGTFTPSDAAYVFGTISVENMTPAFNFENFGSGFCWIYLWVRTPNDDGWIGPWKDALQVGDIVKAMQFSSGSESSILYRSAPFLQPQLNSNQWGPVPFVIGADTVFTPKYPSGIPEIDDINFELSVLGEAIEFEIGKTW